MRVFTSVGVGSVVALDNEFIMKNEAEYDVENEAALEAMSDAIKRRMKTSRSEWLEVTDNGSMFTKARARLQSKKS